MQQTVTARTAVDDLVDCTATAISAFMRGDMDRYFSLITHSNDFTLMAPFGGEPTRGYQAAPERIAELKRYFQGGEATIEVVETYATADMVVLVMIERQHGEVGGLPDQNWSLRVTQIYRRRGSGWELVHRHADPLVRNIGLNTAAAVARGELRDN